MKPKGTERTKSTDSAKGPGRSKDDFHIVAIGASAGGIEAITGLLRNLPPSTGMAFVIIQHLDPKHQSFLTELLSKETAMKVVEMKNGMEVQPNYVYVIPTNASISIHNHSLQLASRGESRTAHMLRARRRRICRQARNRKTFTAAYSIRIRTPSAE